MVGKGKRVEQTSARKEVERLFSLAKTATQDLADRYVALARQLASRNRISLRAHNREHCRKCSTYFSAKTLRVRTRPTHAADIGRVRLPALRAHHADTQVMRL
jgi:RNase P subunit RPR2